MRDLVTSKLAQCQVKAQNTRFAIACLYKDVNEIHDKLKAKDHTKLDADENNTLNDIHEPPNQGYGQHQGQTKAQGSNSLQPDELLPHIFDSFADPNSPLTPKLYSFQTTFRICMPTTHHIFISVRA